MRFFILMQVLVIAGAVFFSSFILGEDDETIREAIEVIDALEREQDVDIDLRQVDPCEDDCDPAEPCDCASDDCIPDECLAARTIDTGNDEFAEAPRKKIFGFIRRTGRRVHSLLCRNTYLRRRPICSGVSKK